MTFRNKLPEIRARYVNRVLENSTNAFFAKIGEDNAWRRVQQMITSGKIGLENWRLAAAIMAIEIDRAGEFIDGFLLELMPNTQEGEGILAAMKEEWCEDSFGVRELVGAVRNGTAIAKVAICGGNPAVLVREPLEGGRAHHALIHEDRKIGISFHEYAHVLEEKFRNGDSGTKSQVQSYVLERVARSLAVDKEEAGADFDERVLVSEGGQVAIPIDLVVAFEGSAEDPERIILYPGSAFVASKIEAAEEIKTGKGEFGAKITIELARESVHVIEIAQLNGDRVDQLLLQGFEREMIANKLAKSLLALIDGEGVGEEDALIPTKLLVTPRSYLPEELPEGGVVLYEKGKSETAADANTPTEG